MAAAAGPGAIQEVGSKEELDAAIAARDLVVVDFFAEWCRPCKVALPIITKMAELNPAISFVKVDADAAEDAADAYSADSLPTILVFHKGTLTKRFAGLQQEPLKAAIAEAGVELVLP